MTEFEALAFVKASAVAVCLPLEEGQALRVAVHMQRTAQMASLLETLSMPADLEPVSIFSPAPFPNLTEPMSRSDASTDA